MERIPDTKRRLRDVLTRHVYVQLEKSSHNRNTSPISGRKSPKWQEGLQRTDYVGGRHNGPSSDTKRGSTNCFWDSFSRRQTEQALTQSSEMTGRPRRVPHYTRKSTRKRTQNVFSCTSWETLTSTVNYFSNFRRTTKETKRKRTSLRLRSTQEGLGLSSI